MSVSAGFYHDTRAVSDRRMSHHCSNKLSIRCVVQRFHVTHMHLGDREQMHVRTRLMVCERDEPLASQKDALPPAAGGNQLKGLRPTRHRERQPQRRL